MSIFSKLLGKKVPLACTAVIAAAGSSERYKREDKLFALIDDKPVIAHSIEAFQKSEHVRNIIIVTKKEKIDEIKKLCEEYKFSKVSKVVVGGETRLESVLNGVNAVSSKSKLIAIHDAARPCVSADIIRNTIKEAEIYKAAAPVIPVSSTLKRVYGHLITDTVSRDDIVEVQTPQVFRSEIIKAALTSAKKKAINVTDDCMAVEKLGVMIHTVEGSRRNIKITVDEDFEIAENILKGAKENP